MISLGFPKQHRLLTRADFKRTFSRAKKQRAGNFTLFYAPNEQQHARLGIAIAKKQVARAPWRNRLKRVIRESFRHHQAELPALDIVVIGYRTMHELDNKTLREQLDKQWLRLCRRKAA